MQTNWLGEKMGRLMGPSLVILMASSIFRGLLGLVISVCVSRYGLYDTWSPVIRLPIEIVVFLGVFVAADICYASVVGNIKAGNQRIKDIISEDPPKYRGSPEAIQQAVLSWEKTKAQREAFERQDLAIERKARMFFAAVSLTYGTNFIVQSALPLPGAVENGLMLYIEWQSLIVGFVVLWYYAARYRPAKEDPAEKAAGLMEDALLGRLDKVSAGFRGGGTSDEDLNLAQAALAKSHPYQRFVQALRRPIAINDLLTTSDIFDLLGVTDESVRRAIRRDIAVAHKNSVEGVTRGDRNEWRISGAAFFHLFKRYLSRGQTADKPRTNTARQPRRSQELSGQSPDQASILSGQYLSVQDLSGSYLVPGIVAD